MVLALKVLILFFKQYMVRFYRFGFYRVLGSSFTGSGSIGSEYYGSGSNGASSNCLGSNGSDSNDSGSNGSGSNDSGSNGLGSKVAQVLNSWCLSRNLSKKNRILGANNRINRILGAKP